MSDKTQEPQEESGFINEAAHGAGLQHIVLKDVSAELPSAPTANTNAQRSVSGMERS